jgi:hypothetical protein
MEFLTGTGAAGLGPAAPGPDELEARPLPRITVAGWTTEMASVQLPHRRDSRTQIG